MPDRYVKRSVARVSCNIAVVVSMNVAKMTQRRQDGVISDCKAIMDHGVSQHRREYGASHDGTAPMIIALQAISTWKAVQPRRQTSFIFMRDPSGISDFGFSYSEVCRSIFAISASDRVGRLWR